jgi:hypothetical protein
MMRTIMPTMSGYVLGHEDRELERLTMQAAFYRPLTLAWLARAGLTAVGAVMDGTVGFGPDSGAYQYAAETMRTLLPLIVKLGIATAEEVDVDTLAARLRDETVAAGASIVPAFMIGAWGTRA